MSTWDMRHCFVIVFNMLMNWWWLRLSLSVVSMLIVITMSVLRLIIKDDCLALLLWLLFWLLLYWFFAWLFGWFLLLFDLFVFIRI